jgi:hypothetical protein
MSDLKHPSDHIIKHDTHDAIDELKQRAQAEGERLNRAAQGDAMPLGERVASNVREAGHNIAAETDKVKRDVRDNVEGKV